MHLSPTTTRVAARGSLSGRPSSPRRRRGHGARLKVVCGLSVLAEALERLFYDDLDASCHARHVDGAATSDLARDRLGCVVAMVE